MRNRTKFDKRSRALVRLDCQSNEHRFEKLHTESPSIKLNEITFSNSYDRDIFQSSLMNK